MTQRSCCDTHVLPFLRHVCVTDFCACALVFVMLSTKRSDARARKGFDRFTSLAIWRCITRVDLFESNGCSGVRTLAGIEAKGNCPRNLLFPGNSKCFADLNFLSKPLFSSRLPFRGPDTSTDPIPSFAPVSSWVNLNREQFKLCLDPSKLKKSPTNANSNEQTRRFQVTCQLAVSSIVYCKTFFMPEDFDAFHSGSISLEVHDALRPGIVRVLGAAIEREFAQFVFSLLLEILDACLVGDCFI